MFKPSIKFNVEPKVLVEKVGRDIDIKGLKEMGDYDVLVGWNTDAKAKDENGKMISIAKYAKANNYGVYGKNEKQRIVPRPFVTNAINNEKYIEQREEVINRGVKAMRRNMLTAQDVLNALGIKGVENIRHSIKNGPWEANRPSTLIRKLLKSKKNNGLAPKPLIDTGQMIDRVTYVIRER